MCVCVRVRVCVREGEGEMMQCDDAMFRMRWWGGRWGVGWGGRAVKVAVLELGRLLRSCQRERDLRACVHACMAVCARGERGCVCVRARVREGGRGRDTSECWWW